MIVKRSLCSAITITLAGLLLMPLLVGFEALAQESEAELAKKTQNPVANLISIPFQNNINFGIGPNNRMQNVLNVQPVVPISPCTTKATECGSPPSRRRCGLDLMNSD